jgi:hypothetical protein
MEKEEGEGSDDAMFWGFRGTPGKREPLGSRGLSFWRQLLNKDEVWVNESVLEVTVCHSNGGLLNEQNYTEDGNGEKVAGKLILVGNTPAFRNGFGRAVPAC